MVNVETARETEPPTLQENKHDDAEKEETKKLPQERA